MKIATGKIVTVKMYVHADKYASLNPDHHNTCLLANDMSDYGYTCLGAVSVEYKIPECNVVEKIVESLEKQIQKERAECQIKSGQIEDHINN